MLATILLKLLLFLAVFELASAIAGHRVYGTRFSIALPRITTVSKDDDHIGSLYMTTEEERSTVKIYYPLNAIDQKTGYIAKPGTHLKRNTPVEKFIPATYSFPINSSTGVYNTVKIRSTSPIRVILNRYTQKHPYSADSHNVMPFESCSTSFYVSTGLGHAFLMVMTFDYIVNIKVTFPKTGQRFNFLCHPETRCKDDASGMLTLRRNKAWYVEQERASRFLNTLIETDKPVFVIAGNKALESKGREIDDVAVTSIYPTDAWGKEYIVPRFVKSYGGKLELVLQFNAKKLPFKFKTYDCFRSKYSSQVLSSFDSYFTLKDSRGFTTITAEVPFGLYQIFGLQGWRDKPNDCVGTIVNLIPTEQWTNGVVIRMPENKYDYVIKVFMSESREGWALTGSKKNKVRWESRNITNLDRTYMAGEIRMHSGSGSATFFTEDPTARIIAYQFKFKQTRAYYSCSVVPLDFYQARIHQTDCEKQKTVVASDGVDNDCDGRVDEEVKDEKDNDGDGIVDEDLVEPNGLRGEWTPWTTFCASKTGRPKSPIRVRSCRLTRFAKDCLGPVTQCPKKPAGKCGEVKAPKTCRCPDSCWKCKPGHVRCGECQFGYYDDRFCLRPCPPGWVGKGCAEWHPKIYPAEPWTSGKKVSRKTTTTTTTTTTTASIVDDGSHGNSEGSIEDSVTSSNDTGLSKEDDDDENDEILKILPWVLIPLLLVVLFALCICVCVSVNRNKKRPVQKGEEGEVVEGEKKKGDEIEKPEENPVNTSLEQSEVESSVDQSERQSEVTDYSEAESEV